MGLSSNTIIGIKLVEHNIQVQKLYLSTVQMIRYNYNNIHILHIIQLIAFWHSTEETQPKT